MMLMIMIEIKMMIITSRALSANITERVVIEDVIEVAKAETRTFVVIVCWHVLYVLESIRIQNQSRIKNFFKIFPVTLKTFEN